MDDFQIIVGGAAGEGSKVASRLIAAILKRYGYFTYVHEDYQSLVKGGHNFSIIRASREKKEFLKEKSDFLLAINRDTFERHIEKLDGLLIYNSDQMEEEGVGVNIQTISREEGKPFMANTALVAGFSKALSIDKEILKEEAIKMLSLREENEKIIERVYREVEEKMVLEKGEDLSHLLLTGNEAVSLGMLKAGLEHYYAYPMTPSTGILHFLSKVKEKYKIKVFQAENEIAVINAAIGSAFSGKRTAVGTSGGGLALMSEGVSLSAISETPMLIVEGQRMGPATGVPTYSGQSDLLFSINAGHGDFLKMVFTPSDGEEAFHLSKMALNLSWKYQMPSILLMDRDLCENTFSFSPSVMEGEGKEEEIRWSDKGEYQRYQITPEGISPFLEPGRGQVVKGTGYEHNQKGITTEEEGEIKEMQEKRIRKEEKLKEELQGRGLVKVYGEGNRAILSWGTTSLVVREVAKELNYKVIQPLIFSPLPEKELQDAFEGVEELIVVECNYLGQAASLIEKIRKVDRKILKHSGRPFSLEELREKICPN